jgi:hypothetical protein
VELSCLNKGKKLLMQQASCYVPLVCLKHGNVGNNGHVCSFPADVGNVCVILPRLLTNCQFVKIIKKHIAKDTSETQGRAHRAPLALASQQSLSTHDNCGRRS